MLSHLQQDKLNIAFVLFPSCQKDSLLFPARLGPLATKDPWHKPPWQQT
jgi:hypothetical protein